MNIKCALGIHKTSVAMIVTYKGMFNSLFGNKHQVVYKECERCEKRSYEVLGEVDGYGNDTSDTLKFAIGHWMNGVEIKQETKE